MDPVVPSNAPDVLTFFQQRDLIWLLLQAITVTVPAVFLFTGRSARLRSACVQFTGGRRYLALLVFATVYLTVAALLVSPVEYWLEVSHRVAWRLPASTLAEWLADQAKGLVVQIVAAAALLWIPFALIRRAPRTWWLAAAALGWLLVTAALISEQIWIRPMTTRIEPLADGALKARFDALAARCGRDAVPVFVGGQDVGGTVVGAGPLRRIYMSQYEIDHARTAENEVVSTFAHELEHYLSADPELALGWGLILFLAGGFLTHIMSGAAIRRWWTQFGFASSGDLAALPLMIAILTVYWTFAAQPILNAVQRQVEMRADRFALDVTHDNRSRAAVLAREASSSPWRLHEYYWFFRVFRATHPSDAERVRLALSYRPWNRHRAGDYAELCRPREPRLTRPAAGRLD
jgi:Zn-dependent protease with chaperone function